MAEIDTDPAPGSPEAVERGCTCPIIDNAHGQGYLGGRRDTTTGDTLYVVSSDCDLHRDWERNDA